MGHPSLHPVCEMFPAKAAMTNSAESHRDSCRSKLEAILREVCQKNSIPPEADLVTDLGLDSVAMIRFIIQVEETFGVVIGGREIDENVLKTFSSLLNFILSK